MTDEQVIEALECCHSELGNMCSICPLFDLDNDYCEDELHKDALDLINRQKAEIDELRERISYLEESIDYSRKEYNWLLQKLQRSQQAKSEVIKRLAERIKQRERIMKYDLFPEYAVSVKDIDDIVKEIVGENNV